MNAKAFEPEVGAIYKNRGGGSFRCIAVEQEEQSPFYHGGGSSRACAVMQNIKSSWTFTAKGIVRYADGTIEWDHSVGGRFEKAGEVGA